METFSPGDRVVAINTDMSGPLYSEPGGESRPYSFPNGPLRRDVIYRVDTVVVFNDGIQGLYLTGMRVFWGNEEISWHSPRFRKVDALKGHVPKKCRRRIPALASATVAE